jgi:hypothetical protein
MRPMRASEAARPSLEDASHNSRRGGGMTITARHNLLSDSWTADVEALETAIRRFKTDRHLMNNCEVVFFELVGNGHLHVNVTHTYVTKAVSGWAGRGRTHLNLRLAIGCSYGLRHGCDFTMEACAFLNSSAAQR